MVTTSSLYNERGQLKQQGYKIKITYWVTDQDDVVKNREEMMGWNAQEPVF